MRLSNRPVTATLWLALLCVAGCDNATPSSGAMKSYSDSARCPAVPCFLPSPGCWYGEEARPVDNNHCPIGCPPVVCPPCGDGLCDPQIGESCSTCPADCGVCQPVCPPIDCPAPPDGCTYVPPPRDANGCSTGCGALVCNPTRCSTAQGIDCPPGFVCTPDPSCIPSDGTCLETCQPLPCCPQGWQMYSCSGGTIRCHNPQLACPSACLPRTGCDFDVSGQCAL
jgi:hypothetical protein